MCNTLVLAKFNGRKGKLGAKFIDLDTYNSELDCKGYIFQSFRKELTFEFEIPLTAHCNLNCQMCTVFSPVARKEFVSMDSFYRDISRMGELYGSTGVWFRMVGGEPLLHPKLVGMMTLARKKLPNALISITTNGLLAQSMGEDFYRTASEKNIVMLFSPYPPIRTGEQIAFMTKRGINAFRTVPHFHSRKMPLDPNGLQDGAGNFKRCTYRCNFLLDGKLSRCFYPLTIRHFNRYFKQNLEVSPNDVIDIHNHTSEEINCFLNHQIDFCKYCKNERPEYFDWKQSQKDLVEWV